MPSWFYLKLTLLAPASLHKMLPRRSGSCTPICLKLHHALVEAIEFCSFKLNLSKPQAGVGAGMRLGRHARYSELGAVRTNPLSLLSLYSQSALLTEHLNSGHRYVETW